MNLNKYRIASAEAYPESLQVEVNRACALGCVACRRTRGGIAQTGCLPDAALERLEPVLAQADVLDISGWGEPLNGETVWRLLDAARWSRINTCLTTSGAGAGLSEEACARLVGSQVGQVTVSLDAGTPEVYRRLRPGAELAEVVLGITRLARVRKAAKSPTPFICVSFNFHEESAAEFPAFVRLVAELPVYKAVVHPCFPVEASSAGLLPAGTAGWKPALLSTGARGYYEAGMALAGELGVRVEKYPGEVLDTQLGLHNADCDGKRYLPTLEEVRRERLFPTCRCAWDHPFVDHTGDVFPCSIYPEPFGNLEREPFERIWDGERFKNFRRNLVTHRPDPCCLACHKTMWYHNRLGEHTADHLAMGSEGLVGLGWYGPERVGQGAFRWSRGQATVYLRNYGRPRLYFVISAMRQTRVEVALNGQALRSLAAGPRWEARTLELPVGFSDEFLQVSLRCPDAQNDPAATNPWSRLRLLGVAVSQVGTCASERDEEVRRALRKVAPRSRPIRALRQGLSQWMRTLFMP